MARLSSPVENIKNHHTVVVIGAGYVGGIEALHMARVTRPIGY